jgi:hypothetical protein
MAMSNISTGEFQGLMGLLVIGEIHNIPQIKDFVNNYLISRVSVNGQGRKDIIQIITKEPQQKQKKFISLLKDVLLRLLDILLRFLMKIPH